MSLIRGYREALGVLIDGREIQVAHVRMEKDGPVLLGLERATLVKPLEDDAETEAILEELGQDTEPDFDSPLDSLPSLATDLPEMSPVASDGASEGPAETNSEVVFRLLRKFPVRRCLVALALAQPCVTYGEFENVDGLKGRRLQEKMRESAGDGEPSVSTLTRDRLDWTPVGENRLLWVHHEDPLTFLDLTDELKPFLGKLQYALIDSIEVTLMNAVRAGLSPDPGPTAVVYVGEAFSRVVFMHGNEYLAFSRAINEGIHSPDVLSTIHRRILYEQDTREMEPVTRVIMAGACRTLDAEAFFEERFPEARVTFLEPSELNLDRLEGEGVGLTSVFAVPIGLAWKALNLKDGRFYATDFLPKARRKAQNPLEVAWHGVALLCLLAGSTLLLGMQAREQGRDIERLNLSVELLEQEIASQTQYADMVHSLRAQIADYERNFALIDTLSAERRAWSTELWKLSDAVRGTGKVWLNRVATSDLAATTRGKSNGAGIGLSVAGRAFYRERTPVLAERIGDGYVSSVEQGRIRDRAVYDFQMQAPVSEPVRGE